MRLIVLLLALATSALPATTLVCRWCRFEQTFESRQQHDNPLTVDFTVELKGPGGAVDSVAGFWDGGRTWRFRYSPDSEGHYQWTTRSSDRELDNQSGAFTVTGAKGRGWPRISGDRRHFEYADGTPFFWLGDTAWNGALLSTREEWNRYLRDRAAKRFTVVQLVMTQFRAARADERGEVAFTASANGIRVNPSFFQRMDGKVTAVNREGLVAAPVVLWALTSKDRESPGEVLPDDQAATLAAYMVARYNAYGVLWILGGDGDYRGDKAERWKTIGRAVFPQGRSHRPVTLHPRGMQSPWAGLKDEPWLDFFMFQSGHGNNARKWQWNAMEGMAADWKLHPPHPVIDGEINYEAHIDYNTKQPISDYQVRRAAWYSVLAAPPAGVTYGAHGIWFWSRKPEVPLDHPSTGVAQPWWECLDYPGAKQMKAMRDVLDRVEWWRLRPDRSLLKTDAADAGFTNYAMPARADNGRFALIYFPAGATAEADTAGYTTQWIDPVTGESLPDRPVGDALLLLRAR